MNYSILICPVCREQIEDSYEGGFCHAHLHAKAEIIEVELPPTDDKRDYLGPVGYAVHCVVIDNSAPPCFDPLKEPS